MYVCAWRGVEGERIFLVFVDSIEEGLCDSRFAEIMLAVGRGEEDS